MNRIFLVEASAFLENECGKEVFVTSAEPIEGMEEFLIGTGLHDGCFYSVYKGKDYEFFYSKMRLTDPLARRRLIKT